MEEYIKKIREYYLKSEWINQKKELVSLEELSYEERKKQYDVNNKIDFRPIIKTGAIVLALLIVGIILCYIFSEAMLWIIIIDLFFIILFLINGIGIGFDECNLENRINNVNQIKYRQKYKEIRQEIVEKSCKIKYEVLLDEDYSKLIFGTLKGKAQEYGNLYRVRFNELKISIDYGEIAVIDGKDLKNATNRDWIKYRGIVYALNNIKEQYNIRVLLRENLEDDIIDGVELKFKSDLGKKYFACALIGEKQNIDEVQKYFNDKIEIILIKLKAENRMVEIEMNQGMKISIEGETIPRFEGNYTDELTFVENLKEFKASNYEEEYIEDISVALEVFDILKDEAII